MQTKLVIDGGWVAAANSFPVVNPATEEVVHHIPAASAADADAAVRAARAAFDAGPWPRMTGAERAVIRGRWRRGSGTVCPNSPGSR